jgi:UPF0755 protein
MSRSKKKKPSRTLIVILLGLIAGLLAGIYFLFGPNTGSLESGEYLYIRTGATYSDVISELNEKHIVRDLNSFQLVAGFMRYEGHIRAGRYKVKKGMSNYSLVRMLRSGNQAPVRLVIKKVRTRNDLARQIGTSLEADSSQVLALLNDSSFLSEFGVTPAQSLALIIPDTYEFFWNTSAEKTLRKLGKQWNKFWNDERRKKVAAKGITPVQAMIIASVVEEETNIAADKPKIASVYLNRVRIGMPLQADPTVKYAIGDFTIKRITGAMLQFNSPYNTYMYPGLPPGPICTPSTVSINAVVEAPQTTYMYFCAKPDFSGYSVFASTYNEQINNANAYRRALDKRGIH